MLHFTHPTHMFNRAALSLPFVSSINSKRELPALLLPPWSVRFAAGCSTAISLVAAVSLMAAVSLDHQSGLGLTALAWMSQWPCWKKSYMGEAARFATSSPQRMTHGH